jgi:outer membrane protein assembly factor BamD
MKKIVCVSLSLLFLASCSDEEFKDRPLDEVYNEAMDNMLQGYYVKAAKLFEDVERQYPYNEWAKKSQIMAGYCYYKGQKNEEAVAVLKNFTAMHPGHELSSYATYLVGLIHYARVKDPRRDHKGTEDAYNNLEIHIKRFPRSIYVKDAKERVDRLKELLAAKEIEVARQYQKEEAYVSALGRFQTVIQKHHDSKFVPEAYYRLIEVFVSFGDLERATEVSRLLEKNYPGTLWSDMASNLLKNSAEK